MACLTYTLAFRYNWGLFGIWMSKALADSLVCSCYSRVIFQIDWVRLAQREHDRMFSH